MTAAEVAALLPALLARLNPGGEGGPPSPGPDTPQPRRDAASGALRPETPAPARLVAARRMQEMARPSGWQDNRLGFARFVLGRLQTAQDRAATATALTAASDVYATLPDQGIHLAQALMQLGGLAVARGQYADAIARACRARPPAILAQTAAPLDWLQLIKAEALAAQGFDHAAAALRLDSLPAARYGFGTEAQVRAPPAEIAAGARQGPRG